MITSVSEFNYRCFLRSRCSMEMCCLDDTGRESWVLVGPPTEEKHDPTPWSVGVGAPRGASAVVVVTVVVTMNCMSRGMPRHASHECKTNCTQPPGHLGDRLPAADVLGVKVCMFAFVQVCTCAGVQACKYGNGRVGRAKKLPSVCRKSHYVCA